MMEAEIEAAVQWWSQQLRGDAVHIIGDAQEDVFVSAVQGMAGLRPLSEEEIQQFAESLRKHLIPYVERYEVRLSEPLWNAYFRIIGTDYGPLGGPLNDAAKEHNISFLRFPMKTIMWINPGIVKVRPGHGCEMVVVYGKETGE